MEAVAAFVYGAGGVVSLAELARFFMQHANAERDFYAAASPVRQLKKIFRHFGLAHGLAWVDGADTEVEPEAEPGGINGSPGRGHCIVHNLTAAQRESFPRTIPQWIPRCLAAVEAQLRTEPGKRLRVSELGRFYAAYPDETTFMRARIGSISRFVMAYDAHGTRLAFRDAELLLVGAGGKTSSSSSTTTTTCGSTSSSGQSSAATSEEEEENALCHGRSGVVTPLPPVSALVALQALRVLGTVLTQQRVFRSSVSLPVSDVLAEVWRLVQRTQPMAATRRRDMAVAAVPSENKARPLSSRQKHSMAVAVVRPIEKTRPVSLPLPQPTIKEPDTAPVAVVLSVETARSLPFTSIVPPSPPSPPRLPRMLKPDTAPVTVVPSEEMVRSLPRTTFVAPPSPPSPPRLRRLLLPAERGGLTWKWVAGDVGRDHGSVRGSGTIPTTPAA